MDLELLQSIILEKPFIDKKPKVFINREFEQKRILQILSKSRKNNCILIGKQGVGKSYLLYSLKDIIDPQIKIFDDIELLSQEKADDLKEKISNQEVQCVVATSVEAYKKYHDNDGFFAHNFTPLLISEPSADVLNEIMQLQKQEFEAYHQIGISNEAVEASIEFSKRYLYEQSLPAAALDLLDEACSQNKFANNEPLELWELRKNIDTLKKACLDEAKKIELNALEAKYNNLQKKWQSEQHNKYIVSRKNIAELIANLSELSIDKIMKPYRQKVFELENNLKQQIIGQEKAITQICNAIKRKEAQISNHNCALSFYFKGPLGVGKYKTCKELANFLFDAPSFVCHYKNTEQNPYQVILTDNTDILKNKFFKDSIIIFNSENDCVDEIIDFSPLEKRHIREIARLQILDIQDNLKQKNIKFIVDEQAYMFIVNNCYNKQNGLKNMRNFLKNQIENKIAQKILTNEIKNNSKVEIFFETGQLLCREV